MLVIGHRGAAGLAPENTLEALRAGMEAGADMLEFDVRLTKDKIPVLVHDFHALRTHKSASIISRHTFADLQKHTDTPIVKLVDVLDEFFGKILLNIELKGRGTGKVVANILKKRYIKKPGDWDNLLISSYRASELWAIRRTSKAANLALLHSENPFIFIAYQRHLQLTAVGFHRLYLNPFALEIAKRAGLFTYAYTVNRPGSPAVLAREGIDGVVTDRPDVILEDLEKHTS
jgi:glycerophosphoryl diester phosphodiesterase